MNLIQQVLEKTNHEQETRTASLPSTLKMYDRNPIRAALEREPSQLRPSHAGLQRTYWKVFLGVLLICFIIGLCYVWIPNRHPKTKALSSSVASHMPLRIFSGTLYRLTGITNTDGKSIAVINEKIVSVGDSLPGKAIVKAIGQGEVSLDVQGREIKLKLAL
ncbi:MAG: hypothetical protein WC530_05725 [Candidatus Omnitrophota bacterium]|jgi:hypothetical protein